MKKQAFVFTGMSFLLVIPAIILAGSFANIINTGPTGFQLSMDCNRISYVNEQAYEIIKGSVVIPAVVDSYNEDVSGAFDSIIIDKVYESLQENLQSSIQELINETNIDLTVTILPESDIIITPSGKSEDYYQENGFFITIGSTLLTEDQCELTNYTLKFEIPVWVIDIQTASPFSTGICYIIDDVLIPVNGSSVQQGTLTNLTVGLSDKDGNPVTSISSSEIDLFNKNLGHSPMVDVVSTGDWTYNGTQGQYGIWVSSCTNCHPTCIPPLPPPGLWTFETSFVDSAGCSGVGRSYFSLTPYCSMDTTIPTLNGTYNQGDNVTLWMYVQNSTTSAPIYNANVTVFVTGAVNNDLTLYDDGTNGDEASGDGNYTYNYNVTSVGDYDIVYYAVQGSCADDVCEGYAISGFTVGACTASCEVGIDSPLTLISEEGTPSDPFNPPDYYKGETISVKATLSGCTADQAPVDLDIQDPGLIYSHQNSSAASSSVTHTFPYTISCNDNAAQDGWTATINASHLTCLDTVSRTFNVLGCGIRADSYKFYKNGSEIYAFAGSEGIEIHLNLAPCEGVNATITVKNDAAAIFGNCTGTADSTGYFSCNGTTPGSTDTYNLTFQANVSGNASCQVSQTQSYSVSTDNQPPEIGAPTDNNACQLGTGNPENVTITVVVDESSTGGSLLTGATLYNYTIGTPEVVEAHPMSASDGAFDSTTETVTVTLGTFNFMGGVNYYINATDDQGNVGTNYNASSVHFFNITDCASCTTLVEELFPDLTEKWKFVGGSVDETDDKSNENDEIGDCDNNKFAKAKEKWKDGERENEEARLTWYAANIDDGSCNGNLSIKARLKDDKEDPIDDGLLSTANINASITTGGSTTDYTINVDDLRTGSRPYITLSTPFFTLDGTTDLDVVINLEEHAEAAWGNDKKLEVELDCVYLNYYHS